MLDALLAVPEQRSQELREFFDSGAMERLEMELKLAAMDSPEDASCWRRLGELQRRQGKLEVAARSYSKAAELESTSRDFTPSGVLARLLDQTALPACSPAPARFAIFPNALGNSLLKDLRKWTLSQESSFQKTAVQRVDGSEDLDHGSRRSLHCSDLGPVQEWLSDFVAEYLELAMRRLDTSPFVPGLYSCKLNAYLDGHFFRLHQDKTEGIAGTRRLGFVLFFEIPPRRFRGGELLLYDRDLDTLWPAPSFTTILPQNNSLIFIPANCWHEVLPVRCEDEFSAARFTLSGWIHDEDLLEHDSPEVME
jgi:hypothetical protein